MKDPILFAHRGLAGYAPENTRPAYIAALELGFGLEVDLRLTADGQIVVVHDATVDRTTDGRGKVEELTLEQIERLDAGRPFDPLFAGLRVPTLEEVLALARNHSRVPVPLLFDVKSEDERMVAEVVRQSRQSGMSERIVLIGLVIRSPGLRRQYKEADPEIASSVLADVAEDWEAAVEDPFSTWIYARFVPSAGQVAAARQAGKQVLSSGPVVMYQKPENWRAARRAGVGGLLTDYPFECRRSWRGREQE